ncbi:MAG TPA: helix-turn-helix transcriptional regulator [Gemmatimonadaceae bacterium]|nr:helix-turn-helix transcriptional regulator [Gemmatimonadaceae bacterium]
MSMRDATPDEPLRHRTADVTRGRIRLVEHSWPENVKTSAEHRHTAHICFLAHGALEEKRGTSSVWRVAPNVRVSPTGDGHACCYGNAGGRCLVIEPSLGFGDDDDMPAPHEPTIVQDQHMVELAARAYHEMRADSPHSVSGLVIESIALEVLAQSARWERRRAERRPPPWLCRLQEFLASDLALVPDLARLAIVAGVHRVHVARAFRDHLGCTVGDYVRRLRVRRACELLTCTALPLTDVAMRAGFFDQSHMTRVVKGFLGVTPAVLRRDYVRQRA